LHESKEADITAIIAEEKLKPEETRRFMDNAFRDGTLKTTGTAIDKIMPPVSRFANGGREVKKQGVIEKLLMFFEKYLGLV
jgi:type I restriction enzyme R subunit